MQRAVPPRRQRGAALMILMLVVVLGGAWWLVSGLQARGNRTVIERTTNGPLLATAKQALIAYVAQQAFDALELNPGRLPCPEAAANIGTVNEGIAAGSCALPAIGRLPWKTLGIDKPQDASGEPLWYVVSPGWAYKNSTVRLLGINSNSQGNLTVDGTANAAVALIVSPGPVMQTVPDTNQVAVGCAARSQVRTPSAPNYLDYLECIDLSGLPTTIRVRTAVPDAATSTAFNDQSVTVSAAEIMAAVEPVVAVRIQRDVVPALSTIFNTPPAGCTGGSGTQTNVWGVSFTCGTPAVVSNPVFPFAAPFRTTSTGTVGGNAAPCGPNTTDVTDQPTLAGTSAFIGGGCTQGFLPINSVVSNVKTGGPFGHALPTLNTATGITVTQTGGSADSITPNCGASTPSQIQCSIDFSKVLCLLCVQVNVTLRVQGDVLNVGNGMYAASTVADPSGLTAATTTRALQANAAWRIRYEGSAAAPGLLCGAWILPVAILCSGTVNVTVPIPTFSDHAFLQAAGPVDGDNAPCGTAPCTTTDAWFWFLANKWHQVTYYAVAPLHAPGGAGGCSGATCISVTVAGGTNLTDKRAVLALAGRSVTGTTGAARALSDFLDLSTNTDQNLTFQQNLNNRTFNDRFVAISP